MDIIKHGERFGDTRGLLSSLVVGDVMSVISGGRAAPAKVAASAKYLKQELT